MMINELDKVFRTYFKIFDIVMLRVNKINDTGKLYFWLVAFESYRIFTDQLFCSF